METKREKIKILLIDNDEMMRIYFCDVFWVHGRNDSYQIDVAASLKEAEEKIKKGSIKPNTIFLDILLPVQGEDNSIDAQIQRSLSFVKNIKNNKELSNVKIIIYSNHKEKKIQEEFDKLNVDGHLTKGEFMPKEIIAFVDKIHERNN